MLSEFCFASAGAAVKAAAVDLPLSMLVFFRNVFALMLFIPILQQRGWQWMRTPILKWHITRGAVGLAAMYCFFYSLAELPLADGMLLKMTTPLFIPVMAYYFLRESLTRHALLAVALGFIGVILVIKPSNGMLQLSDFNGVALIGLLGGILAAMAMVSVRRLSRAEPTLRIVFYFALQASIVSAIPLLWSWQTPSPMGFLLLFLVGLGTTAGQVFLTHAYGLAPAARIAPFTYASVLFAGFYGYWFWQEIPDIHFLFGALLIAAGGLLALYNKPAAAPVAEQ